MLPGSGDSQITARPRGLKMCLANPPLSNQLRETSEALSKRTKALHRYAHDTLRYGRAEFAENVLGCQGGTAASSRDVLQWSLEEVIEPKRATSTENQREYEPASHCSTPCSVSLGRRA